MNIEQFLTFQTGQMPGKGKASAENLPEAAGGKPSFFMDLVLTQLAATPETSNGKDKAYAPLQSDNPALEKKPGLDAAMLADSEEIAEDAENISLTEEAALSDILALNQQAFDEILSPLEEEVSGEETDVVAEEENLNLLQIVIENKKGREIPGLSKALNIETEIPVGSQKGLLRAMLNKIENFGEKDHPGLIVSNLTPEELTALKEKIQSLLQIEADAPVNEEEIADVPTGDNVNEEEVAADLPVETEETEIIQEAVVHILPPQESITTAAETPKSIQVAAQAAAQQQASAHSTRAPDFTINNTIGQNNAPADPGRDFGQDNASGHSNNDKPALPDKAHETAVAKTEQSFSLPVIRPDFSAFESWSFGNFTDGSLYAPSAEYGIGQASAHSAALSSLITQVQSAGQAHPASQMVAVSLMKNAGRAENRNFMIQMDPPELGRVEVRMNFGKDKIVKVELKIEKPETYAMLQRDSHILERTLQDIGLDTSGGMNFELAHDDQSFSHNGGHDGRDGQGKGSEQESEMVQIETSMDWFVDPDTGHTYYSILA